MTAANEDAITTTCQLGFTLLISLTECSAASKLLANKRGTKLDVWPLGNVSSKQKQFNQGRIRPVHLAARLRFNWTFRSSCQTEDPFPELIGRRCVQSSVVESQRWS